MRRFIMLYASLAVFSACKGHSATDTGPLYSGGDFAIAVTSGVSPTFSWPGGNALWVSVSKADAVSTTSWDANSTATTGFPSPVAFGARPSGTWSTMSSFLPLVKGSHYLVSVGRADGRQAVQEFIP